MNTPIVRDGVAEYVAAVRAHLSDLSRDEVDELTGDLEADLDDALDDGQAGVPPSEQFGPPSTYADELRAAAGLPPRAEEGKRGAAGLGEGLRERVRARADAVRAQPWWPAVHDFALTIRPAWWVIRALCAAALVSALLSVDGFGILVFGAIFIVVSVELGRRGFARRSGFRRVLVALGNGLAVLVVLMLLGSNPFDLEGGSSYSGSSYTPQNGLWVDGTEVRNVFPYDDQGRPLSGIQLFDENGRPVQVGESARTPVEYYLPGANPDGNPDANVDENHTERVGQVPAVDGTSRQLWNVFPLRQQGLVVDLQSGEERPDSIGPRPATLPRVSPGPLLAGGNATATRPAGADPAATGSGPATGGSGSESPSPTAVLPPPATATGTGAASTSPGPTTASTGSVTTSTSAR